MLNRPRKPTPYILLSDAAALHRQRLETQPEVFGARYPHPFANRHGGKRGWIMRWRVANRRNSAANSNCSLPVTTCCSPPTTAITAPLIEGAGLQSNRARSLTRFTALFNLTGLPALSLPCGFSGDGLPIGLQLVGAPWNEARVLQAAFAYESGDCLAYAPPTVSRMKKGQKFIFCCFRKCAC